MITILIIALLTYIAMIFFTTHRTSIAVLGSGILLIYGTISNSFPANLAFEKFPKEIIMLVVVLSLFAKVFENIGLLNYISERVSRISKGNKELLTVILLMAMYVTSIFMNNLSVILLFTPMVIKLSLEFKMPILPMLIAGVISSNIGGAALPWSDTPAVIITLCTDFSIIDFLTKLFVPCFIYAVLLVVYTVIWSRNNKNDTLIEVENKDKMHKHPPKPLIKKHDIRKKLPKPLDKKALKMPLILFVLFISGVCIGPFFNLSIAYISMFFCGLLLIIHKESSENVINSLNILDLLIFIVALFLIGGVFECSGITTKVVKYILTFTNENRILIILVILISAFIISTFLSAGPAAATLLPICSGLSQMVGHNLIYAALAFGILAGSSMFPWSATGGPIMYSEVKRFLREETIEIQKREELMKIFKVKKYIAFSFPFSFCMLAMSGIFLSVYSLIF